MDLPWETVDAHLGEPVMQVDQCTPQYSNKTKYLILLNMNGNEYSFKLIFKKLEIQVKFNMNNEL